MTMFAPTEDMPHSCSFSRQMHAISLVCLMIGCSSADTGCHMTFFVFFVSHGSFMIILSKVPIHGLDVHSNTTIQTLTFYACIFCKHLEIMVRGEKIGFFNVKSIFIYILTHTYTSLGVPLWGGDHKCRQVGLLSWYRP